MRGFLSNYFDLLFSFKLVLKTFLFATVLYVFIATCPWSSVSVCTVPVNQSLCYSTLELVMTLLLFLRCIYASEIAKQCWSESCKQCYRKCAIVTFSLWLRPTTRRQLVNAFARICLSARLGRLLKNTCMDLDEMLRVDRYRDMDELINFWAWSRL